MERKDFGFAIKSVSATGLVEGYGSTFGGEPDSYGDIVQHGAFADSIATHKSDGTMPLMLWGHQSSEIPIGEWTDMEEDEKGLFIKGQIDIDDPVGARVYRALDRKRIKGLSIGYATVESTRDLKNKDITILEKLDLFEVSVVNFPANRNAGVERIKAEKIAVIRGRLVSGDMLTLREMESLLKHFGLSNSEAERAARVNFKDHGGHGQSESGDDLIRALSGLLTGN